MARIVMALSLILSLLLVGCNSTESAVQETSPQQATTSVPNPRIGEGSQTLKATPALPEEKPEQMVVAGEPPPDRTWISPGKVQIGNFYAGARAEWDLSLHNGESEERTFSISYRHPDRVEKGFEPAPGEAKDWVIIADASPVLAPRETRNMLVVLELPDNAEVPPQWEFWVAVKDISQGGMVQTVLCSRWLVRMRK